MEHIAIQKAAHTYDDWNKLPVLCRCSTKKDVPYGKVVEGDRVYFLFSGQGIRSLATVSHAISQEYNDIKEVRALCKGTKLYDGEDYWRMVGNRRYATIIWLANHELLPTAIHPKARSYGASWIVLNDPKTRQKWLGT